MPIEHGPTKQPPPPHTPLSEHKPSGPPHQPGGPPPHKKKSAKALVLGLMIGTVADFVDSDPEVYGFKGKVDFFADAML